VSIEEDTKRSKKDLLPKGHSFAIIHLVKKMGHKLLKLRSPITPVKWDGDWGPNGKLWDLKLKQAIGEQHFHSSVSEETGTLN
jgi:hypothetical protein